jgi:cholesterol transport system auxiliary component
VNRTPAAIVVLAFASGCALTGRGTPAEWQWFTPEKVQSQPTAKGGGPIGAGPSVRIRTVASGNLETRIAYGDGAYQGGYYEERRWTERPELYVRRSLERTLCQERGFRCNPDDLDAPALDVEILKFQELKTAGSHQGLVALRIVLSGEKVLVDDTVQVVVPVRGDRFDDVVAAIANALDRASADVASRVRTALTA